MRPRDLRKLIQDIQLCVGDIEELTKDMTFEQYVQTKVVRLAVERQFITIGESIARMKRISDEAKKKLDDAIRISDFRNFLVHEYEAINDKQVWKAVQESLPILKQQINAWADELGMEPPPGQTA